MTSLSKNKLLQKDKILNETKDLFMDMPSTSTGLGLFSLKQVVPYPNAPQKQIKQQSKNKGKTVILISTHYKEKLETSLDTRKPKVNVKNVNSKTKIKSLKHKTVKNCLIAAENIVNSRPLTYLPIESKESESLTPNHFLIGSSNGDKRIGFLNEDIKVFNFNYLYREQFANKCWQCFISEYIPELLLRAKWHKLVVPIKEGDIVIICDKDLPRCNWPKGEVIEVKESPDGQVRRAIVQTKSGIYERPVIKLAEALNMVYNDNIDLTGIYKGPTDPNVMTDEGSADEDNSGFVDNLSRKQLLAEAELSYFDGAPEENSMQIKITLYLCCDEVDIPKHHCLLVYKTTERKHNQCLLTQYDEFANTTQI
ncbi:unnamed protein product [Diabrotica balteata]|uniref:DUF5641 domain-containing protein n=1 Tax=Diabrotica balteata TaxID=107213 RepID=A0A9N9T9L7_DIABA|nr:unnamed protein product [Diabrotica balteata]